MPAITLARGQSIGSWDSVPLVPGVSTLAVAKKLPGAFYSEESAVRAAQSLRGELRQGPIAVVAKPRPEYAGECTYELVRLQAKGTLIPLTAKNIAYGTESGEAQLVQKEICLPPWVHALVAQDGAVARPGGVDALDVGKAVFADIAETGRNDPLSRNAAATRNATLQRNWQVAPLVAGLRPPQR